MKTIEEVLKLQEKFDEEIKLKDSIHFLNEYCDKHEYCDGCYIRRKAMLNENDVMFQHGSCLFKTLINFCEDKL